jgi:signal transduction histidine kinase/ligand-binding sensor domain-containing protein
MQVFRLVAISGIFLTLSVARVWSEGETLARLAFWVPPECKGDFGSVFEKQISPLLAKHGIRASSIKGRPTAEGVYSRLFEMSTPAEVAAKREKLTNDSEWQKALGKCHSILYSSVSEGALSFRFELYSTPSGPGKTVLGGRGKGHWRAYGTKDGLPKGMVRSVIQDREGYIWVAIEGGGVCRFDGQVFSKTTTEDGLIDDGVQSVIQDRDGNLWFGTMRGVSRFDGEKWTNFTTEDGLANDNVWSITEDRDGNLWFGLREGGLSRYDGEKWTTFNTEDGLGSDLTPVILQDRQGFIWVGTFGGGVSRYDGENWATFTTADGLAQNNVLSIFEDRDGDLWFGTWTQGVSRYDGENWTTFTVDDGLVSPSVRSIIQDQKGDFWFGTESGVSCFAPVEGTERRGGEWSSFRRIDGFSLGMVQSIIQDRDGYIWFATASGLGRYSEHDFVTFTVDDGLADNRIGIGGIQDRGGDFWFGTWGGGVIRYDGENWTTFKVEDGLAHNAVFPILQDLEGNFWFGTLGGGVSRYDGESWETYSTADGLPHNSVRCLTQGREGGIWMGTLGGVIRYMPPGYVGEPGATWTEWTTADGLVDNMVHAVYQDREGSFWFGTQLGVSRYRPSSGPGTSEGDWDTFTTLDGLADNTAQVIFQDRDGDLWFGTMGGLSRYNPPMEDSGDVWTSFTTADGLAGNWVFSIIQNRAGHLWYATYGGASRYDGEVLQTIDYQDGLAEDGLHVIIDDQMGQVWFGSLSSGITRFCPPPPSSPPIAIEAVVADRHYEDASKLKFSTGVGLIVFKFGAMSFTTRREMMRYRFRLQGYDEDWRITNDRQVEYQDLPVGEYRFEVQAVDRDLNYSEEPATVWVRIHLPYGQMGLIGLLGVALVVAVVTTKKMTRSHQERDRALSDRNQALEQANARLQETDRLKSDFVSNVSHELRTPLTVIKGSVDNMLDGITGAFNEKQERYLHRLKGNSDRLSRLINDLLDLSRIEAGYLQLHLGRVWVQEVCQNVVESLTPLAEEMGIDLQLKDDDLSVSALGDPDRVHQILLNLVNNAIKFTPSGGRVEVGVVPAGEFVRTSVSDTGEGIPGDQRESVFEKFFQVGGTSSIGRGAGIGLSIARRLVELHGGRIWVESEEGLGSTFLFTLPVEG